MAHFHSHRKPGICQVPRGILRRHRKVETVPRRFKYAYSASTDYSLGKRTITPWVVVAKFLGWKIADWKKSALSTSLIKVHSLPDAQRSNKSLSTLFYFSSPWSCRRFLAVCLIWCRPPGVKRRQLLSPANCYKTFRSLSFMQLASASMLPSQYELGSHNDVPISSGSWHVGAVYNLPSKAREPPAVHLIVPFLLNTFILSEVAALNN